MGNMAKNLMSLADVGKDIKELVKEIKILNKHLDSFIKVSENLGDLTSEIKNMVALFSELKG